MKPAITVTSDEKVQKEQVWFGIRVPLLVWVCW